MIQEHDSTDQVYPQDNMVTLLAGIPLFMDLPDNARQELANVTQANWYRQDAAIIREGESGNLIFLIARGSAKICKNNNVSEKTILTTVGYGEVIGEMAILDGLPRSADVITLEDTLVFSLRREDFLVFLKTNPEATLKLIAAMSLKLRNTNELVIKHQEMQEQLRYLSQHDSLTGLYNRAFLQEELDRLDTCPYQQASLIISDIDGLKIVNDTLGHEAGDNLLVAAAQVIRKCFREDDLVARVGGDEFAVLLRNSSQSVVENAERRIQQLLADYNANDPTVPLSISVGFAIRDNPSVTIDQLYQEADTNMYKHKLAHGKKARKAMRLSLLQSARAGDTSSATVGEQYVTDE